LQVVSSNLLQQCIP